eukprot:COSAG01_NODE_1062_length_11889_cov_62.593469_8_plen_103_part_00
MHSQVYSPTSSSSFRSTSGSEGGSGSPPLRRRASQKLTICLATESCRLMAPPRQRCSTAVSSPSRMKARDSSPSNLRCIASSAPTNRSGSSLSTGSVTVSVA